MYQGTAIMQDEKIRIIQGIGLPRRADTKNQRTDTLVRRFKMFLPVVHANDALT